MTKVRLFDMELDEVSLVPSGDDPEAKVVIFKAEAECDHATVEPGKRCKRCHLKVTAPEVAKGDKEGHPFHGNQWTFNRLKRAAARMGHGSDFGATDADLNRAHNMFGRGMSSAQVLRGLGYSHPGKKGAPLPELKGMVVSSRRGTVPKKRPKHIQAMLDRGSITQTEADQMAMLHTAVQRVKRAKRMSKASREGLARGIRRQYRVPKGKSFPLRPKGNKEHSGAWYVTHPNKKTTPKEIVGHHGHVPHGPSILWPALYEHLRAKGMPKSKAAAISNAAWKKHRAGVKTNRPTSVRGLA